MSEVEWTLIDTETTGLIAPIYVVELAAQRMKGWNPIGPPFQAFLNHNVDVPIGAERVHGYNRAFLSKNGIDPLLAHRKFFDYARVSPIVSYNLRYDYDKVLIPEWSRLQFRSVSKRGFCALKLTQKLINPSLVENFKLQTLKESYRLPDRKAHSALGDVQTVIDLIGSVLRPLAESRGVRTYSDLENYVNRSGGYPDILWFGKHKGRNFREAVNDVELLGWLRWLSRQEQSDSANIGKWYLAELGSPNKQSDASARTLLNATDEKSKPSSETTKIMEKSRFKASQSDSAHTPQVFSTARDNGHLKDAADRKISGEKAAPLRGEDLRGSVSVTLETAARGGAARAVLSNGREMRVIIPAGAEEGTKIRLAGKGGLGTGGGEPGDAFFVIKIVPHPLFKVSGRDLKAELPVTRKEAIFGGLIVTSTLGGRVELRVPPGSTDGRILRLRGKGLPTYAGKMVGDLYLILRIRRSDQEALAERVKIRDYQPDAVGL